MKTLPIDKFGTKLMVASKSINKIPSHFLKIAQNARIFDGGIGPRRGKTKLTESTIGTNNKGGFILNDNLYQITNSKIYQIDLDTGEQIEKADLGYDKVTDNLVYAFSKGSFINSGTETLTYTTSSGYTINKIVYDEINNSLKFYETSGVLKDEQSFIIDNRGKSIPAVRIIKANTDNYTGSGSGKDDGLGVILLDNQYINVDSIGDGTAEVQVEVGYYESKQVTIIASEGEDLNIFDGDSIIDTVSIQNSGIIEYTRGFSFLTKDNTLLISRPITPDNPEYAYDFTGSGSQQIVFDNDIVGLEGTMNGLFIFTEKKVEYLGANALQSVAGSATFISTPLGKSGEPVSNHCIASSGDKVFYITKSLQLQTVNYIQGTDSPSIGVLSAVPIVGIKELLNNIDDNQPTAFTIYNKKDQTIQFHLRRKNMPFNDVCLVYDLINETYSLDTGKNYNYVVENGQNYYGFSDINSNIYNDDVSYNDAGIPIRFLIRTQEMNLGSIREKLFAGFFTAGAVGFLTKLDYTIKVDKRSVFQDSIEGEPSQITGLGEIGVNEIGVYEIAGGNTYDSVLTPFEKVADEGRIYRYGTRIQIEISSTSEIQDFIIDTLGTMGTMTNHLDINNKF